MELCFAVYHSVDIDYSRVEMYLIINSLSPNIHIQILQTDLYTFS